jgi:hypothetical protein
MNPIAIAALVAVLGAGISMAVAGMNQLLFVGIRALKRRPAGPAADAELPVLVAGDGEVLP